MKKIAIIVAVSALFSVSAFAGNSDSNNGVAPSGVSQSVQGSLSVTSTTPVSNLTLKNHPQVYEAGLLTTSEKIYSLSDQSLGVLQQVKQDLHVKAFYQGGEYAPARDLLDLYKARNTKISYEFIDPDKEPLDIDLSSTRTRDALTLLDGMRRGQPKAWAMGVRMSGADRCAMVVPSS